MNWRGGIVPFGVVLHRLIKAKGWTIEAFAERVDDSQPNISAIKNGRRAPPLKKVERWAEVLGITGEQREFFMDLAALANAPKRVLNMFRRDHPAFQAMLILAERDTFMEARAAEKSEPYGAEKSARKSRRSQP